MAKKIMVQGTMSGVGKSFIAAGLCRIFKEDGFKVAPFKSQNMALNSGVTADGLEMGRAQIMQAEAACIEPSVLMNPVLLKPTGERGSQVIVMGEVYKDLSAAAYYKEKKKLIPYIREAFESLEKDNDIIVLEGAGSPAEINLNHDDIVNMGMAEMAGAPVLLTGDIDRGGVFAQLAGTMMLLKENEKRYVKGLIINRFRGDMKVFGRGRAMMEEVTGVKVLGVVPYRAIDLDDEDSLSPRLGNRFRTALTDIAVLKLPHISNFTDFNPFEHIEEAGIRFVKEAYELKEPDMLIIPGSKNSLKDLEWIENKGLKDAVTGYARNGGVIFGVCGGLQILGELLSDPDGNEGGGEKRGLSLLPVKTVFSAAKIRRQVSGTVNGLGGLFSGLNGKSFEGYEIHNGRTDGMEGKAVIRNKNVYGTYVHGFFDSKEISEGIVTALLSRKGKDAKVHAFDMKEYKESRYRILASHLRNNLDMDMLYRIMDEGV